jgi:hypothetical protein
MVIVALVALDCLAIRAGSPMTIYHLVFGGLPMQGVLVTSLILVLRRRRLGEKPLAFLTGFMVVGWICHLAYVAICVQSAEPLTLHLSHTLGPLVRAIGFQQDRAGERICRVGVGMAYLTMLQLIPALIAGWIFHWWSKQTTSDLAQSQD